MLEYEYGLGGTAVDSASDQESAQYCTTTEKETQDLFREICIQSQLLFSHSQSIQKTDVSVSDLSASEMPEKYGKRVNLDYSKYCARPNSDQKSCDLTEIDHNTINFRAGNPTEVAMKEQIKLTCLKESVARKHLCNTLVVVLQVNPSNSVQIKNGPNKGEFVTIASILVGDESLFYVKVTLWNKACDWIKLLNIGDLIILENVASQKYRNERSLQTNGQSQLYHFHDGRKHFQQIGKLKILVCLTNTALITLYLKNFYGTKS